MSADKPVWYALQVFHHKENALRQHLEGKGVGCFLPMRYAEHTDTEGRAKRILVPAIHNLLFVQCGQGEEPALAETLQASPYASRVYTKTDGCWCDIGSAEMAELRAASDPGFQGTLFVEAGFAATRRGTPVCVVRGPLKGLKGKLVRYTLVRRAHRRIHRHTGARSQVVLPPLESRHGHSASAREKTGDFSCRTKTPPQATRCATVSTGITPRQEGKA